MIRRPGFAAAVSIAALALVSACSSHDMNNMGGMDGGMDASLPPSSEAIAPISFDAVIVVNGGDSTLSVINAQSNEVAATIKLMNASYPHHLYLSADRSKMLLAVPGMDMSMGHEGGMPGMMGAVMLMDATTGSTISSRITDSMNHNAIFSPDGTEVWTSQMTKPGAVLVLDSSTLETKQSVAVGDQPAEVTFTPDGKYAFVANGASNSVSVVDAISKTVVKTISVGVDPVGAWQGSNGVAYVDNETAKTVTAIDTTTLSVKLTYNLGFMPGMARLGPDGMVWVTDAENGKVVLKMTSMDMTMKEIPTGAGAHAIAFSDDGTTAYITNQTANTVSVIDVAGQQVTKTIPVGQKPNGLVWRAK